MDFSEPDLISHPLSGQGTKMEVECAELLYRSNTVPGSMRRETWKVTDYDVLEYLSVNPVRTVCHAMCKASGEGVCLKLYNRRQLSQVSCRSLISRDQVLREIRNHGKVNGHPNIVALWAAFEDRNVIVLVMEMCALGSLARQLQGGRGVDLAAGQLIMWSLLSAVSHIHDLGLCHCDIKLENILLTEDSVPKLADFGLSLDIHSDEAGLATGSLNYCSPELVGPLLESQRSDHRSPRFSPSERRAGDVWSSGILAFELLTGRSPFMESQDDITECMKSIVSGVHASVVKMLPPDSAKFVQQALTVDKSLRPSSKELLSHPWLSGMPPMHKRNPLSWRWMGFSSAYSAIRSFSCTSVQ
mmetsp:Transcript_40388/g.114346  ORF Transcript_40388/g.114346 Transcript_40388/m.114346 type:complete len:358 (+) Transcript_40388:29-1102(+)